MTDFLADLERQLLDAHPRRRSARRRAAAGRLARSAPVPLATAAVLAGGAWFVVATAGPAEEQRTAAPPPAAPAAPAAAFAPKDGSVTVLNGTPEPGLARAVATFLSPRHRVVLGGNAPANEQALTTVLFADGHRTLARGVASTIGADIAPLDDTTRAAADGADVVVLVGADIDGAARVAMRPLRGTRSRAQVDVLRHDGTTTLALEGKGFTPGPDGIAVWVRGPGAQRWRWLGYATQPVRPRDALRTVGKAGALPAGSEVVLSRERGRPKAGAGPKRPLQVARLP